VATLHAEDAALSDFAADRRCRAEQAREVAADEQAEPGAAEASRRAAIDLRERLEQPLLLLSVMPMPESMTLNTNVGTAMSTWSSVPVTSTAALVGDLMALPTRFSRIWRRRIGSVSIVLRDVAGEVHLERQVLLARPHLHQLAYALHQLLHRHAFALDLQAAGLDLDSRGCRSADRAGGGRSAR